MRGGRHSDEGARPSDHSNATGSPESAAEAAHAATTSRRSFLRRSGLVAAGVVAGGAGVAVGAAVVQPGATYIPEEFSAPKPRKDAGFDHLVVLMGENRSFDNLLGYLYTPENPPAKGKFEGLAFGDYANAAEDGTRVAAHPYSGSTDHIMGRPEPDPGEEYPHVNTQLFGVQNPENRGLDVLAMLHPFNAPEPGAKPEMTGFVRDYESEFEHIKGRPPSVAERDQIMGAFTPEMLPVTSTLAREFGVFDHWFCAVPSQTFCNRSFFHASTSHGFVTNKGGDGYRKWLEAAAAPTVFNRLEEAGLSWRIYFDELQLISFTGVLHAPVLKQFWKTDRFATMAQFHEDTKNGTLPAYAFVEPRMIYNHNDFHPPVGTVAESDVAGQDVFNGAVSDARAGDALVHEVYSAVRGAMSEKGSNYLNTALLITFDEHGGTYDHVPPPAATPPAELVPGEMGFTFDRLGCRVPAILVSAHVERGSVFTEEMHHGALAASLSERFGLESLTARDHGARTLRSSFNRKVPRHVADWPNPSPAFVPPNIDMTAHPASLHGDRELSPPANGLIGLLLEMYGNAEEKANPPKTFRDAYRVLTKYGDGLFGVSAAPLSTAG